LTKLSAAGGARDVVSLLAPGIAGHTGKEANMFTFTLRKFVPTLAAMMLLTQLVQAEPVNINTADATALAKALTGVGPAKAKAIVSYRDKNGPFKSVEQLAMVEGITQKLIDKNRADIRLGADKGGAATAPAPAAAKGATKPAS
jgi:competence protein ComEA